MLTVSPFLAQVESYLQITVAPQAMAMDRDPEALREGLAALGARQLLALRVPQRWGGAELSPTDFGRYQELVARHSGALAFLQAQHQSAGRLLAHSANPELKAMYLPQMARGERLLGIAFSHLRRSDKPAIVAQPVPGGYCLHGVAPWATGFAHFEAFIVAAVCPDGQAVYGLVPFQDSMQPAGGRICLSPPMSLGAFSASNTVSATVQNWMLSDAQVVAIRPADAIQKSDVLNVLQHSFFALGCAQAGLDIVAATGQAKSLPFVQAAWEQLNQELQTCRNAIFAADDRGFKEQLQLRAWAIAIAGRCAHAAVAVSSGAANDENHPAQRVYREALVFTVTGQTPAVMEATLAQLTAAQKAI